jgi:glycosyltransferase involved in cell wall biosynthesis
VSSEKGIGLFCAAITALNLKGCVLGDGPLKEKMAKAYPNIRFAGWVTGEQKDMEIRKGKALVFPSLWYECAPLTIQETKSYGLPCIVPDTCAASEEVEDGRTGYIFKSGNLESLKDAIVKLEQCDLMSMQSAIISGFDKKLYSLESHCSSLQNIYIEVMKNSCPH